VYEKTFEIGQVKAGDMITSHRKGQLHQQWIITKVHPAYLVAYISYTCGKSYLKHGQNFEFFKSSFISWQTKNVAENKDA
jgi:hypothetical protein